MKKHCIGFSILLLLMPVSVSADSYDGPYCFEGVKMNDESVGGYGSSTVRGTCKEIKIFNFIKLDPSLQKDYLLGTHVPIKYNCERYDVCANVATYSEQLLVTSSSSVTLDAPSMHTEPVQAAVFDKSFMIPLLSSYYKKANVVFSENNFPSTRIHVFKKEEFEQFKNTENSLGTYYDKNMTFETLVPVEKMYSNTQYLIRTFFYQQFGKYIHAPKGEIFETQYANLENGKYVVGSNELGIPDNKELGIKEIGIKGRVVLTVPVTSPLQEVRNIWLYTKKNGKLTLSFQKTEYVLDKGSQNNIAQKSAEEKGVLTVVDISEKSSISAETRAPTPKEGEVKVLIELQAVFQKVIEFIMSFF